MSKSEKNQCQARTKSGTRCERASRKSSAFCTQHWKKLKDCLWAHPGGIMDYLPDPPPLLTDKSMGFWRQYCGVLKDHGKLWGAYLGDMHELCWRIDYRDEVQEKIDQYGLINMYENGPQLIGLDKILDRNDKRITDLKKQFGLTLDTANKLTSGKSQREKPEESTSNKAQRTGLRKVKSF